MPFYPVVGIFIMRKIVTFVISYIYNKIKSNFSSYENN